HLIANGTDAVVVGGTTGESATLSTSEKIALSKYVVQVVDGRIPVIAGSGTNNTRESIELTREAELAGADAAMIVAPYYNSTSQEGLYQHIKTNKVIKKLLYIIYIIP